MTRLFLEKKLIDCHKFKGTPPGIYDFDHLVESDAEGYSIGGQLLFKFRKAVIPRKVNDAYPNLADICTRTLSLRSDAVGDQVYEESRIIGYDVKRLLGNCASETTFTRSFHGEYKKLIPVIEMINGIYRLEFPESYYRQERLPVDPHFLIGNTVFSQCILNRSFRTCLHRDRSNAEGTISSMICLGDESFSGGYLVLPEYRVAVNMRPRDYLGFPGKEIWHGNTEIKGPGTRLTIVCYLKKEFIGKEHEEEIRKLAKYIEQSQS